MVRFSYDYWGRKWEKNNRIYFQIFPTILNFFVIFSYLYVIPILVFSLLTAKLLQYIFGVVIPLNSSIIPLENLNLMAVIIGLPTTLVILYMVLTQYGTLFVLDSKEMKLGKYNLFILPLALISDKRIQWYDLTSLEKIQLTRKLIGDEHVALIWSIIGIQGDNEQKVASTNIPKYKGILTDLCCEISEKLGIYYFDNTGEDELRIDFKRYQRLDNLSSKNASNEKRELLLDIHTSFFYTGIYYMALMLLSVLSIFAVSTPDSVRSILRTMIFIVIIAIFSYNNSKIADKFQIENGKFQISKISRLFNINSKFVDIEHLLAFSKKDKGHSRIEIIGRYKRVVSYVIYRKEEISDVIDKIEKFAGPAS